MIKLRPLFSCMQADRVCAARHKAGFTLVEMLVVLTIIALILGLVGPRVLNYLGESRSKTAKLQIESFGSALDLFYLDTGRYPTIVRGSQCPGAAADWRRDLERPLRQGRQSAFRSLGQSLSVPFVRGGRAL